MRNRWLKFFAFGLSFAMCLGFYGCSKNDNEANDATATTQQAEEISQIDILAISVASLKNGYDSNVLNKANADDALTHAMVTEGFVDELPELYGDAQYKEKITEVYNYIQSMDLNKAGLNIEEGADETFKDLKQVVERMYGKLY